jgi:hypothetical protein
VPLNSELHVKEPAEACWMLVPNSKSPAITGTTLLISLNVFFIIFVVVVNFGGVGRKLFKIMILGDGHSISNRKFDNRP